MGRRKDKNRVFENVAITAMAAEGKSLGRIEDKVIFVPYTAPGDIIDVRVTKSRSKFFEGVVERYEKKSADRVEPPCPHFGTCGGCKWQHIPYEKQLEYKQQQVVDCIDRIAKVAHTGISPIVGSEKTYHYRNKMEFTFTAQKWLTIEELNSDRIFDRRGVGFHVPGGFAHVIDLETCYLTEALPNAIRDEIKAYAFANDLSFFHIRDQVGLLRNLVIRNTEAGELLVMVIFFEASDAITPLMKHLGDKFPEITSLLYIINPKQNDSYSDLSPVCVKGNPYLMEAMNFPDKQEQLQFKVGPTSFYQTNSAQAFQLYKKAFELAELTGEEVVYDLYTGAGTIANFVAHKAKKVVGVEYIEAAIEDAKVNSELNNITNTSFFAGDMKDVLNQEFVTKHGKPDVIITDPPRAGIHDSVLEVIMEAAPQRIIYISCNPATQARDLQTLDEEYKVTAVVPVDMFPMTHHVENIVRLERR